MGLQIKFFVISQKDDITHRCLSKIELVLIKFYYRAIRSISSHCGQFRVNFVTYRSKSKIDIFYIRSSFVIFIIYIYYIYIYCLRYRFCLHDQKQNFSA